MRAQRFVTKQRVRVMAFRTDELLWLKHPQHFQPPSACLRSTQKRCWPPTGGYERKWGRGDGCEGSRRGAKKAAWRKLRGKGRMRNKNNECGEEEQHKRKRRHSVKISSSHSSLQPREPQTEPDATATCAFTEVRGVGFFLLFGVFKMSLKCMTVQGKKPEGKGATCISTTKVRPAGRLSTVSTDTQQNIAQGLTQLPPPHHSAAQNARSCGRDACGRGDAGSRYLSLPGWNSESRDGLRRCGCMIDPGGRWEAKSLE